MSPKSHINFLADFCSFQKSKSPIDNFHMVTTLVCCLFNARKVRKVVISEKRLQVLNNTFIAPHGLFYSQCSGPWLYAIGPDVSTYSKTVKTRRQKKVANFADAFTLMCSLRPKPLLKIRTASAIFWNYLGIFRDYGLKYIYF